MKKSCHVHVFLIRGQHLQCFQCLWPSEEHYQFTLCFFSVKILLKQLAAKWPFLASIVSFDENFSKWGRGYDFYSTIELYKSFTKLDAFKFLAHNNHCDSFAVCENWLFSDTDISFQDFNISRLDRADSFVLYLQVCIRAKSLSIVSVYLPPRTSKYLSSKPLGYFLSITSAWVDLRRF